jgi:hypothetical protein
MNELVKAAANVNCAKAGLLGAVLCSDNNFDLKRKMFVRKCLVYFQARLNLFFLLRLDPQSANTPVGQFSLWFPPIEGCPVPDSVRSHPCPGHTEAFHRAEKLLRAAALTLLELDPSITAGWAVTPVVGVGGAKRVFDQLKAQFSVEVGCRGHEEDEVWARVEACILEAPRFIDAGMKPVSWDGEKGSA